jgi:NAD(P)-dependent dehydrogenase (short-subunit alcohol dehydrogenase family)
VAASFFALQQISTLLYNNIDIKEKTMGMLEGKVALITGGGMGMGRAHAVASAREGANVIIVDVAEPQSVEVARTVSLIEEQGRKAVAIQADVTSQQQMDNAVAEGIAQLGQIDILIANAGTFTMGTFWETTEESWDKIIGINLTGAWKSAKAVAPHMIERQSGSIVLISSVNGLEPEDNYTSYVAAKHGVIGLMKNIAKELAPQGIRCNAICPGVVDTPMANGVYAGQGGTRADMIEDGYHYSALKGTSVLSPDDVANTALYLNSELASKVTGVAIPVDAGHLLLSGINSNPVR